MNRTLALSKLNEMLSNPNLVKHCLAVESAMLAYADYYQIPEPEKTQWGIAGLIHDADWEQHPTQHPQIILQWLQENNATPDIINAVASHGFELGVEPNCQMAKVMRAVDELTGLITAVALVKGKSLEAVTLESIKKKWSDKTFARGAKREDIERGAKELDINLDEHINNVLKAMQKNSTALGL